MKIIIDIGHPAHVHLFKNLAWKLLEKGNEVLFTLREKEHETELLRSFGFQYKSFGKKYKSLPGKLIGLLKFDYLETIAALKFKPDLFLSHGSIYAAHAAALTRTPHIALEDTGNMEQIRLYRPFTKTIISPDIIGVDLGAKQLLYPGYHELAYLHPKYFTPDPSVYDLLDIPVNTPYAILRFISWNATHDVGKAGFSPQLKKEIIEYLSSRMKVFLSSENKSKDEFSAYRIKIPPERMHDALSFATLYIGEGTTMAAEAAILGTPSFYVSNVKGQNCDDLEEKFGLAFTFKNPDGLTDKIDQVLSIPDVKKEWHSRREKMLKEKIDLTSFLLWFVESYPESFQTAKNDSRLSLGFM
jgi:predicted glycosyltransferase